MTSGQWSVASGQFAGIKNGEFRIENFDGLARRVR
jgi:hypothetical protein